VLWSGVAAQADIILIPEHPLRYQKIYSHVKDHLGDSKSHPRDPYHPRYSVVVVALFHLFISYSMCEPNCETLFREPKELVKIAIKKIGGYRWTLVNGDRSHRDGTPQVFVT
jgi:hypothetical protein